MRQPGTEFNIDPFAPRQVQDVPVPTIPAHFQDDHKRWLTNTAQSHKHKFCGNVCVNFTQTGGIKAEEKACIETCFAKYNQAFASFQDEKSHFLNALADVAAKGQDRYLSRDI